MIVKTIQAVCCDINTEHQSLFEKERSITSLSRTATCFI